MLSNDVIPGPSGEGYNTELYVPTKEQLLTHLAHHDSIFFTDGVNFLERTVIDYNYHRQSNNSFRLSITVSGGSEQFSTYSTTMFENSFDELVKLFRLPRKVSVAVPLYLKAQNGVVIKIAEFDSHGSGWITMIDPELKGEFITPDEFIHWLDVNAEGGPSDLTLTEHL